MNTAVFTRFLEVTTFKSRFALKAILGLSQLTVDVKEQAYSFRRSLFYETSAKGCSGSIAKCDLNGTPKASRIFTPL
jgi:hypothetical protein